MLWQILSKIRGSGTLLTAFLRNISIFLFVQLSGVSGIIFSSPDQTNSTFGMGSHLSCPNVSKTCTPFDTESFFVYQIIRKYITRKKWCICFHSLIVAAALVSVQIGSVIMKMECVNYWLLNKHYYFNYLCLSGYLTVFADAIRNFRTAKYVDFLCSQVVRAGRRDLWKRLYKLIANAGVEVKRVIRVQLILNYFGSILKCFMCFWSIDRYCILLQPSNPVGLGHLSEFFCRCKHIPEGESVYFYVSRNKVPGQQEILILMLFLVGKVFWSHIRVDESKVHLWPHSRGNPRTCCQKK